VSWRRLDRPAGSALVGQPAGDRDFRSP